MFRTRTTIWLKHHIAYDVTLRTIRYTARAQVLMTLYREVEGDCQSKQETGSGVAVK